MMRYFYICAWTIIVLVVTARTVAMQNPNYRCDGAMQIEIVDKAWRWIDKDGGIYFVFDCK